MRRPRLLEIGLEASLIGKRGLELRPLILHESGAPARLLVVRPPLEREVFRLERPLCRLELTVLLGLRGLALKVCEPARELLAQIVQPIEVLDRVAHPVLGLAAAFLVLRDSRRFFQKVAKVIGLRLDDSRDHALLDDRIAAGSETGPVEHVHDVAAPAPRPVQPVGRLAVARELPAHRNLVVCGEAAPGSTFQIVEEELHARSAQRLARARSVEHHIRHGGAAQTARRDLAHHPSHGVDDVRLAAAVRSDHADDVAGELDGGGIDEGLEACEPNLS